MASSNRLSYPARLFFWLLGYSLLMVGCFVFFQYHREKQFKAAELDSRLQLVNEVILAEINRGKMPEEIVLDDFSPFEDLRISVISDRGDVLYDNTLDTIHRTGHLDREEIRQALASGSGYAVRRHSESTGENYFYSARKGKQGVIVRTAVPYSVSLDSLLEADYGFLWVMGAVTAVMCVLGYFATRRVGIHISRLSRFAENMERGVMISDTEPFPHDELGDISNHLVRLYARLQQANADRDREHRAAMHEQKERERMKKRLTSNINHELKTPVSSIRLCVETMLAHPDMNQEKRQAFLERCLSDTKRLQCLLADVAVITRMDEGGDAIRKERLDLVSVIRDVVADRTPMAARRGMTIDVRIATPVYIEGNRSLLESVFSNLIDNAVAYSGGSALTIKADSLSANKIALTVSDNGTGVSDEHLPRLFERFYRVDKGRSRAAGGTGLGLAIVKNAVMANGGDIRVENLRTGGLSFRMTFDSVT
ncbi:MAG: sensor histidine kinase [Muribaculaceae bacterium]|nr:sensor histidine kinase [Muribaculaceae bacterium]